MKKNNICIKSFLLISSMLFNTNSYSTEQTKIHCMYANNYVSILKNNLYEDYAADGSWQSKTYDDTIRYAFFNIFQLNGGENKFNQIKQACKNQFGEKIVNVQPFSNKLGIFKITDDKYSKGTIKINYYIKSASLLNSPIKFYFLDLYNNNSSSSFLTDNELKDLIIR